MKQRVNIFWFRRDLRLYDNHGLFRVLEKNIAVLPVFVFDKNILSKLQSVYDMRVSFIHEQVLILKKQLEKEGSSVAIYYSTPREAFTELLEKFEVNSVYANKDYEPYALQRDDEIKTLFLDHGIHFYLFKDHVIFEENEILSNTGEPYTVYTPYSRKWLRLFEGTTRELFPSEKKMERLLKIPPLPEPGLNELGFKQRYPDVPPPEIPDDIIQNYELTRNFPAIQGTTRLGIHLRYGTISIRKLVYRAVELSEVFLKELIWREFFISILWHYPRVATRSFRTKYENIRWRNNESEFERWCIGMTGFPMVDAGMRELNETGFMHNRVRMIVAGFLTKHLLIDWRWGEAWFAYKLNDYEQASNNGSWQWAAGSGCDGAPWFRIFNPEIQQRKFDPQNEYVNRWVPELGTSRYPMPLVEHKAARERALRVYKMAF